MKAKLCKIDKEYFLHSFENNLIATSDNLHINCLSMKNCQSIELGYDLDELAKKYSENIYYKLETDQEFSGEPLGVLDGFKAGFQKAIELISDKKFSEEDMLNFGGFCCNNIDCFNDVDDLFKKYQPQKSTEWYVDIIMEIVDYGLDEGGNPFNSQAKLDPDGCLILKIAK
jgi:hypothetical protein